MSLSGNFMAFNRTVQPAGDRVHHGGPPVPSTRHDDPANAIPVNGAPEGKSSGQGAPFAMVNMALMAARGIIRDMSRYSDQRSNVYRGGAIYDQAIGSEHTSSAPAGAAYRPGSQASPVAKGSPRNLIGGGVVSNAGVNPRVAWFPVDHAGTANTRGAYAAQFHDGLSNYANPRAWQGRRDTSTAHGDIMTTRVTGHQARSMPAPVHGEMPDPRDMPETKGYSTAFTGRMLAKNHNDGFMDGSASEEYVTTYHTGGTHVRQWFRFPYSSPTLGAMYSKNTLRGVLPNTVATPYPQPALTGYKLGGMAPNSRQLLTRFTTPTLFRMPPSEAATIAVVNDGGTPSNTVGMGF